MVVVAMRPTLCSAAAVALLVSPALSQVEWDAAWMVQNRTNTAMAYDCRRDRVVLFGGQSVSGALADTWEWDGDDWAEQLPATSPPARDAHALAYDSRRQVVVLFGGRDRLGNALADTWEWDGASWTQWSGGVSPPPSFGHGMSYDPVLGETVLLAYDAGAARYQLYEWNGIRWRVAAAFSPWFVGAPVAFDSARQVTVLLGADLNGNATWTWDGVAVQRVSGYFGLPRLAPMVDDPVRGRLVLLDGPRSELYEWDGVAWTRVPRVPIWPGFRVGHALVHHRGGTLVLGGLDQSNRPRFETWEWTGTTWNQLVPFDSPSARSAHGLAYDGARGRVVLFGGIDFALLSDTWEWDGSRWIERLPSTSPAPRGAMGLAYDPNRQRTLLFGGWANPINTVHGDTWEWDGADWTERLPANSPSARSSHQMAYDSARGRIVLFGGATALVQPLADTWEWDGSDWIRQAPGQSPSARYGHTLAYDSVRRRTVLFGGATQTTLFDDTWEWDGRNWVERFPANKPSARAFHCMAFDGARARIVLFSGLLAGADTWEWDGLDWTQRSTFYRPPRRDRSALVFDEGRREAVLFSGSGYRDTWYYRPASPADYTPFGRGCSGSAGIPALAAAPTQYPWLGDIFAVQVSNLPAGQPVAMTLGSSNTIWGPLSLPVSLGFLGMTGCTMYASGEVIVSLSNPAGVATWLLGVPNNPAILGAVFYNQAYSFDPAANPFGLTTSNAGAGTVGGR